MPKSKTAMFDFSQLYYKTQRYRNILFVYGYGVGIHYLGFEPPHSTFLTTFLFQVLFAMLCSDKYLFAINFTEIETIYLIIKKSADTLISYLCSEKSKQFLLVKATAGSTNHQQHRL